MTRAVEAAARRILIVDDEPAMRESLAMLFRRESYAVTTAPGCAAAVDLIRNGGDPFPVVLTDLRMPDGDGFSVLAEAKKRSIATEVIVMTAYHEHAYDAMHRGAYDFVSKPFPSLREVLERVQKAYEKASVIAENELLRARVGTITDRPWVAGSSAMQRLLDVVEKVAPTRTTVLITGASGTGKDRLARLIHAKSDRAARPFLVVNCGALPEALIESELFGHEKGAFTGAASRHDGILRAAEGGTVLLDEIGELSVPLQVKLLRVLQERTVRPVGGTREAAVDVRVLAATNSNIEDAVRAGRFREDLYYRLNVIRLHLPTLAERKEDIPLLADSFIRRFAKEHDKPVKGITKDAFRLLLMHSFPGNVRELENALERAVALCEGELVDVADLPDAIAGEHHTNARGMVVLPEDGCELDRLLEGIERGLILQALSRSGGVRKQAASLLGVTFRSLRYRLQKLGVDVGDDAQESESDGTDGPESSREPGPE